MLEARERRAERQRQLLAEFSGPLVCFTVNIPGPVKDSPLIRRAFRLGCATLEARLPKLLHRELREEVTGCEAMYVPDGDALAVKAICTAIEDETALGRLFDMDVLGPDGVKLDRSLTGGNSRDCIVCGAPGRGCASRRLHSVEALQEATGKILRAHFAQADRERFAALAVESLLKEVNTTPKPGLVDRRNNGSHRDMDLSTFTASAHALDPYFRECVEIGQATAGEAPSETFARLRQAGLRGEQAMYRATGGVNTHKGAIFTLGLLCGSLGRLWKPEVPVPTLPALLEETASLGREALRQDLPAFRGETAGERAYLAHGITGIRGEAAAGLPSVLTLGLPAYRAGLAKGLSENDAGAAALVRMIGQVEDTTLYHRGGPEGAAWAKEAAAALPPFPTREALEALDDAFIARNLSPGGSADLLAVVYFLDMLQ